MKKKIFASLLAAAMLLSLSACGQKNDDVIKDNGIKESGELKVGHIGDFFDFEVFVKHQEESHTEENIEAPSEYPTYPNLSSALLAMENGKIQGLPLPKSTVDYIIAHNDKFQTNKLTESKDSSESIYLSMMTTDSNTELYDILDGGIKQLKADGTLDKLVEEELSAYIASDPTPTELPKFDGAKTYKIAVTGDLPPMDFVTPDGKAAGFNVALLTEIANIAQVNFELVMIDPGARLTSLASTSVDAIFWVISNGCLFCGEILSSVPEGAVITETYFSDVSELLMLK